MGHLQRLLDEGFRNKFSLGSNHRSKWKMLYGDTKIDSKLNRMLDEIQDIIGDDSIAQLMVHYKACPTCQESLPKFVNIGKMLESRIPRYKWRTLELEEELILNGEKSGMTGRKIYEMFESQAKGVPFIIQNGEIAENNGQKYFSPKKKFQVSYIGKLDLFRFLATTFNVSNRYLG